MEEGEKKINHGFHNYQIVSLRITDGDTDLHHRKNKQLPLFQYISKKNFILYKQSMATSVDQSCPICFEIYDTAQYPKVFSICSHAFCNVCLQRIIKLNPFCPLCRQYLLPNNSSTKPKQLPNEATWNPQTVRAMLGREELDEKGNSFRPVYLSNGERTNIHVGRGSNISISKDVNLVINGKRVENPSDCSTQ